MKTSIRFSSIYCLVFALCLISELVLGQWATNTTHIYNTNSGNVGIGTSNPSAKLNVFNGDVRINATTATRALILDAVTSMNLATLISHQRDNLKRWQYGASGNNGLDDLDFFRYSNTGGILGNPLRLQRSTGNAIFNDGNVLIGKSTQTNTNYKLDVNGFVRANEIVVNTTGADFVFEEGYQKPTLTELEIFIKENKHLPDVPSAKEMQENGMAVGEMQTKLLQKIEELTLYMIELKRENDGLKSKISSLERPVNGRQE